jgi:PAS domain S-box-containing protein
MNSKSSLLTRIFPFLKWPGKLINTRVRLSVGLSVTVLSLVLLAQLFEVIPNPNRPTMEARALQAETLALSGSAIYESTRSVRAFQETLENTVRRSASLLSIGLRDDRDRLMINIGNHDQLWHQPKNDISTDQYIFVPLYDGSKKVGQLELCYTPLVTWTSWFQSDVAMLAVFMVSGSFLFFNLILYRTLKQLDPRGAVPRRVREALDNLAEGLLILDRNNQILLANKRFGLLVGVDSGRLAGENVNRFPWSSESMPWERAFQECRHVTDSVVEIVDAHGKGKTFNISASPVLGEGKTCRGVMVTFDDITTLENHKRELIEARSLADAANAAKSDFLARMSHEIRTPMNAIIGYTEILRQGRVTDTERQKYLGTISASGEHLVTLINDILDLSKIEAGKLSIEHRPCQLAPLLAQIIDTLKIQADARRLTLEMRIEGRIPATIITDETRLRQILINVIGNAIKFTRQGGVRLVIELIHGNKLQFRVADSGVGISAQALEQIFKPFSQADSSVSREFGGTGLGLTISKQLAEALGGGIKAQSEEGLGSVFDVVIAPEFGGDCEWLSEDCLESLVVESTRPLASMRFKAGRILVVDDSEANRDLAALMIQRMGLLCETADNGQQAIELLRERSYDVVFMDVNMPVMDGITATRTLKADGLATPIIALTALAIADERQKCLNAGFDGFVAKPVRVEVVAATIARYLEPSMTAPDAEVVAPGTSSGGGMSGGTPRPSVSVPSASDVESDLARTLQELGFGDNNLLPDTSCGRENFDNVLHVPEMVRSSMPLDDEATWGIAARFVERMRLRLNAFDEALESRQFGALNDLGHWLAGSAATVGFDAFVGPSREIEYSDGSDIERLRTLVQHLHALSQRIKLPERQWPVSPSREDVQAAQGLR